MFLFCNGNIYFIGVPESVGLLYKRRKKCHCVSTYGLPIYGKSGMTRLLFQLAKIKKAFGTIHSKSFLVDITGLEPVTLRTSSECSSQLS